MIARLLGGQGTQVAVYGAAMSLIGLGAYLAVALLAHRGLWPRSRGMLLGAAV